MDNRKLQQISATVGVVTEKFSYAALKAMTNFFSQARNQLRNAAQDVASKARYIRNETVGTVKMEVQKITHEQWKNEWEHRIDYSGFSGQMGFNWRRLVDMRKTLEQDILKKRHEAEFPQDVIKIGDKLLDKLDHEVLSNTAGVYHMADLANCPIIDQQFCSNDEWMQVAIRYALRHQPGAHLFFKNEDGLMIHVEKPAHGDEARISLFDLFLNKVEGPQDKVSWPLNPREFTQVVDKLRIVYTSKNTATKTFGEMSLS